MKIKYYVGYFYRKLISNFFEIKNPKLKLYVVNIIYVGSIFVKKIRWQKYANIDLVETKFGKFYIKSNTYDVICVSPDFERQDIDFMIKILSSIFSSNKSVIFLDIGAYLNSFWYRIN